MAAAGDATRARTLGRTLRVLALGDARQPHLVRWVKALQQCGAEVEALSYQEPGWEMPCAFHLLPAKGPRFLWHRAGLVAAMEQARRFRPGILAALFVPDYGLLGARLADALAQEARAETSPSAASPPSAPGPRLIVIALGSDLLRNATRTPFHARRARQVLRRADVVGVDAAVLQRAALERGAHSEQIARVDWRPDLEQFAFRAERAEGRRRIVSTRQHAPVYDLPTLLRAAVVLARRRSDFELVIAGDGPLRPRLERMAAPLGERVRFTGRLAQADLAALLGSAEIYVSTSRNDSTSVSLLEAMACGTFPVVSAIPGNREWVTEGSSGLIFPPGDAGNLAHKLARALDDSMLRERAAHLNRRRLGSMPSFEESVRQLLSRF